MTSARSAMAEVSPKLAQLTADVLFGDVWERPGLSKRDRSLITVAALVALYRTDQLRGHIGRALDNGVTKDEIGEVINHMAFYAGWPTAANAVRLAKDQSTTRESTLRHYPRVHSASGECRDDRRRPQHAGHDHSL